MVGRRQWQTTSIKYAKKTIMDRRTTLSKRIVLEGGTPRSEGTILATGDERGTSLSKPAQYDVTKLKPQGRLVAEASRVERGAPSFVKQHIIGTWNVRSMYQGKLDIVKAEMERTSLEILGISELRWTGVGYFDSDNFRIYYSGHESKKRNGVAFMVKRSIADSVIGYNPVNDRIISLRISAHPVNITAIQVYAPTSDADEEDVEEFYNNLQEVINSSSRKDLLLLLGDWNAKVGDIEETGITGKYGLGSRNKAGERLLDFCAENNLFIANTCFQQHKRRLYTWTSPDGNHRNQIDYIIGNKRWRSAIHSAKTYPGADCGSDHELLVAKVRIKLKRLQRQTLPPRYDPKAIPTDFVLKVRNRFSTLNLEDEDPNLFWNKVRNIMTDEAKATIPRLGKKKRTKWLSARAIEIAGERRKMKSLGNLMGVKKLNAEFQRQARRDKEAYLNMECRKIEENNQQGKTRDLFKKIREITGTYIPKFGILRNKDGMIVGSRNEVKERWKEYTENLYRRDQSINETFVEKDFDLEPPVLKSEVQWALNQLANNKAPGVDGLPIELFKAIGDEAITVLTALCNKVWSEMTWPKEWKRTLYIPIPKKGDAKDCSNYRTIALLPHASKTLLKILQKRLEPYMEREMSNTQAGFRKGRGTRDQVSNIRWIMEKGKEFQKEIFLCFIDYSKAFDCVDHAKLWNVLRTLGIPEHLIHLLNCLYKDQEASVRTEYGETDWFNVGKGVRQGCILSPYLFNLYTEHIMRMAGLDEMAAGIKIGGININNLRYADDTTLLAETKEDLLELLEKVRLQSAKAGLQLNLKKTKVMSTGRLQEFRIGDDKIEVVDSFIYLGSQVNNEGRCTGDVKRRILLGKQAMTKLTNIMKDKDISLKTKIRLVKALVFPVMMYGCESWTLRKRERKMVDSFELWVWRRLLRIPWTAKITNRSVLDQIKPDCSLEALMAKLKLKYFGHIMRANEGLERAVMLGKVEGSRRRGRPQRRWIDDIKDITGMLLFELCGAVGDRCKWRAFVHEVTRSRPRLDGT